MPAEKIKCNGWPDAGLEGKYLRNLKRDILCF